MNSKLNQRLTIFLVVVCVMGFFAKAAMAQQPQAYLHGGEGSAIEINILGELQESDAVVVSWDLNDRRVTVKVNCNEVMYPVQTKADVFCNDGYLYHVIAETPDGTQATAYIVDAINQNALYVLDPKDCETLVVR